MQNIYEVVCRDKHGNVKWIERFHNLVTNQGMDLALSRMFLNNNDPGPWYVGIKGSGTPASTDTMSSHGTWSEVTSYDETTRPTFNSGSYPTVAILENMYDRAVFTMSGTVDVYGAFLVNNNTKGGTGGKLYGVGNFGTAQSCIDGDTLSIGLQVRMDAV